MLTALTINGKHCWNIQPLEVVGIAARLVVALLIDIEKGYQIDAPFRYLFISFHMAHQQEERHPVFS